MFKHKRDDRNIKYHVELRSESFYYDTIITLILKIIILNFPSTPVTTTVLDRLFLLLLLAILARILLP